MILYIKVMIIKTLRLDNKHWSTNWIPISYTSFLSKKQYDKSFTFLWSENNEVLAICRSYYISKQHIEIGDVWLNPKYRGKYINGTKISILFMRRVISKIWKKYPDSNKISLMVASDNVPAIKMYEKLKFYKIKNITCKKLSITNGIYMERKKRLF